MMPVFPIPVVPAVEQILLRRSMRLNGVRPVQPLPVAKPRFAVLGAGHGGQAMAAHLALNGFEVALYNRTDQRLEPIRRRGGVELAGAASGFAPLTQVTSELADAVRSAQIVMVVLPAGAHRDLARQLAPHVLPGQCVVLNPGRTFGALEFAHVLRENGSPKGVVVAEAQTFLFASRTSGPARSTIFSIKQRVPVAAIPGTATSWVIAALNRAFLQFVPAESVLETSLNNIGALFHPAPTLLNMARIEEGGSFEFYHQGITPSVARVIEAMDRERVRIATALNVRPLSARQWLWESYGIDGGNLYETIRANVAYAGISAPDSLETRYLFEDVPMGLVPLSSLGSHLGIPTPAIDSIIHLACVTHGVDYWAQGRTMQNLGLSELDIPEFQQLIRFGGVNR